MDTIVLSVYQLRFIVAVCSVHVVIDLSRAIQRMQMRSDAILTMYPYTCLIFNGLLRATIRTSRMSLPHAVRTVSNSR